MKKSSRIYDKTIVKRRLFFVSWENIVLSPIIERLFEWARLCYDRHERQGTIVGNHTLRQLFGTKSPYNIEENEARFLAAMQETVRAVWSASPKYRALATSFSFAPPVLRTVKDLERIPPIPTLYFKRNDFTLKHGIGVEVTSSGTSGQVSRIRYSAAELRMMAQMAVCLGRFHGLFSTKPVHYLILGYQPSIRNPMVISKTAYLSTWYAPALSRTYALMRREGEYRLEAAALVRRLLRCSQGRHPVRVIGFPSYASFLLKWMKKKGKCCRLPAGSCALLGGGWKQFAGLEISKEELKELFWEVLGIPAEGIHEFFGAAEHPVLYCTCANGHFHIPAYARVLIRDTATLKPLPPGQPGLVNLLTPMTGSLPLMSVMTDDLGVVHPGKACGCGITAPWLEILGRVGAAGLGTCSAGAQEYWNRQ
ncbi:MAG: hypothetical protein HFI39_15070 [Lachnospiraceae bacterium]|nr:hypothetical protein [Lachnospiraceae bacterium]